MTRLTSLPAIKALISIDWKSCAPPTEVSSSYQPDQAQLSGFAKVELSSIDKIASDQPPVRRVIFANPNSVGP